MKLNFAENLRKLRRDKNLTQEQLAEKLDVSFQSVSRWETAVTYPDIELLPVISEVFDVTVDELIGCSKAMRSIRFDNDMKQYHTMEVNEEKLAFLRKMRKDYPNEWSVAHQLCGLMFDLNSHLDELRALTTEILERCTEQYIREDVIRIFCCMEDEALLPAFLKQYTTSDNMSRDALLEQRYFQREEWEKYEQQRQENLVSDLTKIFAERMRKAYHKSAADSAWAQKTCLCIIGLLTETAGLNLVSGNGIPDLWIVNRMWLGLRLSCALASSGDADGAFEVLEDTVGLFEKFMALPEGTKLTYCCPTLDRIEADTRSLYVSSTEFIRCLEEPSGWEWFNPIRDDERYIACINRFKKFVKTEDGADE